MSLKSISGRFAVPSQTTLGVVLLLDLRFGVDEDAARHVAVDLQLQDRPRRGLGGLLRGVGELDAAGLHPAAAQHLGLDHHRAADLLGGLARPAPAVVQKPYLVTGMPASSTILLASNSKNRIGGAEPYIATRNNDAVTPVPAREPRRGHAVLALRSPPPTCSRLPWQHRRRPGERSSKTPGRASDRIRRAKKSLHARSNRSTAPSEEALKVELEQATGTRSRSVDWPSDQKV